MIELLKESPLDTRPIMAKFSIFKMHHDVSMILVRDKQKSAK